MAGLWIMVDEDDRGGTLAQAASSQVQLRVMRDPFAVRRSLASERVAGLLVCVGTRTLSLKSLCRHVRAALPATCIIALRHPRVDDAELTALCTGTITDGRTEDLLRRLARLSSAFEALDATEVLRAAPPSPPAAPPRAAAAVRLPLVSEPLPVASPSPPAMRSAAPLPPTSTPAPWAGLASLLAPSTASPLSPAPRAVPLPPSQDRDAAATLDDEDDDDDDDDLNSTQVSAKADIITDEATASVQRDFQTSEPEAAREPLEGSGAEILLRLACARRTGRLLVADGAGAGIVDVIDGAPVASTLPTGDGGLYRLLVAEGVLSSAQVPPLVPQGRLMKALVDQNTIDAAAAATIAWRMVREHCLRLCSSSMVRGVFVEANVPRPTPSTTRPPLNVFGLAVEARRILNATEVLSALYEEIASWRLSPTPLLSQAEALVAPFTKGRALAPLLTDTSAQRVLASLEWDRSIGTLLLLALRESGLIDVSVVEATEPDRQASRRAMANNSPRALLGLGIAPDEQDIVAARDARIAQIDAQLGTVTNAEERQALLADRHSLEVACEAMRLQLGFATSAGKNNPF